MTSSTAKMTALDVTLLEPLGRGAYGTVYRAHAARVGGPCAVKVLPWGPSDITAELKRELKRAKAMQRELDQRQAGMFTRMIGEGEAV